VVFLDLNIGAFDEQAEMICLAYLVAYYSKSGIIENNPHLSPNSRKAGVVHC
jgi:hypothetical protein